MKLLAFAGVLGVLVCLVHGQVDPFNNVRVGKHEECHVDSREYFSWLVDVLPPRSVVNGREYGKQSGYPFSPRVGAEYDDFDAERNGRTGREDEGSSGFSPIWSYEESSEGGVNAGMYSRDAWQSNQNDLRELQRFARGIKHTPVTFPWFDGPSGEPVMTEVYPNAREDCDYMDESYQWGICGNLFNYTLNWHGEIFMEDEEEGINEDISILWRSEGAPTDTFVNEQVGYRTGSGGKTAHEYRFLKGTREKMGTIEAHIEELLVSLNETLKFKWDRKEQAAKDQFRAEAWLRWKSGEPEPAVTGSITTESLNPLEALFGGSEESAEPEEVTDAKCFEALRDYLCGIYIKPCMNCRDRTAPRRFDSFRDPDFADGSPQQITFYFPTTQDVMDEAQVARGINADPVKRMGTEAVGIGPRYSDYDPFYREDSCDPNDPRCDYRKVEFRDQQWYNVTPGAVWEPVPGFPLSDFWPSSSKLSPGASDWSLNNDVEPGEADRYQPNFPNAIANWYAVSMIPPCLDICSNVEATCAERLPAGFIQCDPPASSSRMDALYGGRTNAFSSPRSEIPLRNENLFELDRSLHTPWLDLDYLSLDKYQRGAIFSEYQSRENNLAFQPVEVDALNTYRYGPSCESFINRRISDSAVYPELRVLVDDENGGSFEEGIGADEGYRGKLRFPDPIENISPLDLFNNPGDLSYYNYGDATYRRFEYVPSILPCRGGWVEALAREAYIPLRNSTDWHNAAYPNARFDTHLVCVGSNPALHASAGMMNPVIALVSAVVVAVIGLSMA